MWHIYFTVTQTFIYTLNLLEHYRRPVNSVSVFQGRMRLYLLFVLGVVFSDSFSKGAVIILSSHLILQNTEVICLVYCTLFTALMLLLCGADGLNWVYLFKLCMNYYVINRFCKYSALLGFLQSKS